jgi:hypothetical protein
MRLEHTKIENVPVGGLFYIEVYQNGHHDDEFDYETIKTSISVYKKLKPTSNIRSEQNPIIKVFPEVGNEIVFWGSPVFLLLND